MTIAQCELGMVTTSKEVNPRQRILYAGAGLNRLYPGCSIAMSTTLYRGTMRPSTGERSRIDMSVLTRIQHNRFNSALR
jgi:hypothetical protein